MLFYEATVSSCFLIFFKLVLFYDTMVTWSFDVFLCCWFKVDAVYNRCCFDFWCGFTCCFPIPPFCHESRFLCSRRFFCFCFFHFQIYYAFTYLSSLSWFQYHCRYSIPSRFSICVFRLYMSYCVLFSFHVVVVVVVVCFLCRLWNSSWSPKSQVIVA